MVNTAFRRRHAAQDRCMRAAEVGVGIGSYRGLALALARHLDPEARLVTLDSDPAMATRIGMAHSFADRTPRRLDRSDHICERCAGSFDLFFLDADHSYNGVKHDTEIAINLLSDRGYFVWHDYANWGKFSGKNGVPEYLPRIELELPVARIAGSWLAIYSPAWRTNSGAEAFGNALVENDDVPYADPWASEIARG